MISRAGYRTCPEGYEPDDGTDVSVRSFLIGVVTREAARKPRRAKVHSSGAPLMPRATIGSLRRPLTGVCMWLVASLGPAALAAQGFDHSAFDRLLSAHVVDGMVDYDAFDALARVRALPRAASPTFDPAACRATSSSRFWINAYNAYTIQLINTHGERRVDPQHQQVVRLREGLRAVEGEARGRRRDAPTVSTRSSRRSSARRFREPRIHFALVCAAMGCPPLRERGVRRRRGSTRSSTTRGASSCSDSPAKNRVDVGDAHGVPQPDLRRVSRLHQGLRGHARVRGALHRSLLSRRARRRRSCSSGDFTVKETEYDWTLNSQERARAMGRAR